jgi:hypothetical protein
VVACLPLDSRFAGSNTAEADEFLRAIKIRSTTFFAGEVEPSVAMLFYGTLNKPTSTKEILRRKNSVSFHHQVFPASLPHASACNFQRAMVDESGIIRNQMGTSLLRARVRCSFEIQTL